MLLRLNNEADELNTKQVNTSNCCLISVPPLFLSLNIIKILWIITLGLGFFLETKYYSDPGYDFDDEHKKLFKGFGLIWGILFGNYLGFVV